MGIGSKLKEWLFGSHEGTGQKPAPEPIAHERHVTVYEDVHKPPVMKPLEEKKSRARKPAKKAPEGKPKKGVKTMVKKKAAKRKVKGKKKR